MFWLIAFGLAAYVLGWCSREMWLRIRYARIIRQSAAASTHIDVMVSNNDEQPAADPVVLGDVTVSLQAAAGFECMACGNYCFTTLDSRGLTDEEKEVLGGREEGEEWKGEPDDDWIDSCEMVAINSRQGDCLLQPTAELPAPVN